MARFKPYDYKQRIMIPVALDEQVMEGTLEYAIHELVENRLDLTPFHAKYRNDETGRPAINPKILLKIVLLAYSRGIVGSRRIERACHENIIFMALTCDYDGGFSKGWLHNRRKSAIKGWAVPRWNGISGKG
jgi:transposase